MGSLGVGRVHKCRNSKYMEGIIVSAALDWAEYTLFNESTAGSVQVLENKYNVPLSAFTGVLGMPGFTAYSYLPSP
jgi:NADPH-dependent curcumin reductase CurA